MNTRDYQFTRGHHGSLFLASTYTAQTTLDGFRDNAIGGEMAVVKKADGTVYDGATAITAGTEVYTVLKRDGVMTVNASFAVGTEATISKAIGVAGTAGVVTLVFSCGSTNTNCGNCINCVADPIEDYRIGIIENRTNDYVPDEIMYQVVANGSESITSVVTKLVALINDVTGIQNKGGRQRVTASAPVVVAGNGTTTATTVTVVLTGVTTRPFTVSVGGFCVYVSTQTTEAGDALNGFDDIRQYEREGAVQDGDRYMQRAFPPLRELDGSHPTMLSSSGVLYTGFLINLIKSFKSHTYKERDFEDTHQEIYVPNGSSVATKLGTMFAV